MNWFDKLERKLGKFAVRGLMKYIVGLTAFVFLLSFIDPTGSAEFKLMLIPALVMRGEVWRLITYIFIPPTYSMLWIIFILYFYYMVGTSLEHEWGSFRFNIYYFVGMLGTTAAAFLTGGGATAVYLNLSLFLAFARIFPNYQILIFFILPVKIKYLAWVYWIYISYTVLSPFNPLAVKVVAIVSIANYFLFFGKDMVTRTKSSSRAYYNKTRFHAQIPRNITIHRCTVCGKTEKDDPIVEFRYCIDCEGDYEYCMEHLYSHEHKRKTDKGG